jgi:hypothetical protein
VARAKILNFGHQWRTRWWSLCFLFGTFSREEPRTHSILR